MTPLFLLVLGVVDQPYRHWRWFNHPQRFVLGWSNYPHRPLGVVSTTPKGVWRLFGYSRTKFFFFFLIGGAWFEHPQNRPEKVAMADHSQGPIYRSGSVILEPSFSFLLFYKYNFFYSRVKCTFIGFSRKNTLNL